MSHSQSDPEIWQRARVACDLPETMRRLGKGDAIPSKFGGDRGSPECPFCSGRGGKWGLFQRSGRTYFKCQSTSCVACDPPSGHDEIGFIALVNGLSYKDAAKAYLRIALPDEMAQQDAEAEERRKAREERHAADREGASHSGTSKNFPETAASTATSTRRQPPEPPKNPWHALAQRLPLTGPDSERIFKKRGLTHESQELFQIRSNTTANRSLVAGLAADFSEDALVDLGILKCKPGEPPYPHGQLCGFGRTGKWRRGGDRRADKDDTEVWSDDAEPPLIPYFGLDGIPFYLRPHKGGISNPDKRLFEDAAVEALDSEMDEDDDAECSAHVWLPPNLRELLALSEGTLILTEGEFKAMAACQCLVPCIAAPGISFIRNPAFKRELLGILKYHRVRDLVIIFDNEVKDDPRFPNYKPDPFKQFDTQVWAEFTLRELRPHFAETGGTVAVGKLPDSERVDGKADFDGILAKYVAQFGVDTGCEKARHIFIGAIRDASSTPVRDLFPSEGRKIIERKIHLKYTKRAQPFGGAKELKLARAFAEIDPKTGEPVDAILAAAFSEVRGRYYIREKMLTDPERNAIINPEDGALVMLAADIEAHRKIRTKDMTAEEKTAHFAELKLLNTKRAALFERLKGRPKWISTAVVRGEFKLHSNGEVCRRVRVYDSRVTGRTHPPELRTLTGEDTKNGAHFRSWMQKTGEGDWCGPETELQMVVVDINNDTHLRDIHSVQSLGWHAETGCWFFGDCAFLDDRASKDGLSQIKLPDQNGVFWLDGIGYELTATQDESGASAFAAGVPLMFSPHGSRSIESFSEGGPGDLFETALYEESKNPRLSTLCDPLLALCKKMRAGEVEQSLESIIAAAALDLVTVEDPSTRDARGVCQLHQLAFRDYVERLLVTILFRQFAEDARTTIGDYDAWAAIGGALSYALGPELVQEYYCHPGLWISGPFGGGKSEFTQTLVRLMGSKPELLKLNKRMTAAGLGRALAQYSSLPIALDEFRRLMEDIETREHMLRAATERGASPQGTIKNAISTRTMPVRTSPIVSGENSSEDSATRSRFFHVPVNAARRLDGSKAAFDRTKLFRPHYYIIGRWAMKRRRAFAKASLRRIDEWLSDETVRSSIPDSDRIRLTTGVGYSVFSSIAHMLGLFKGEAAEFKACMLRLGAAALKNTSDETFRAQFWRGILSALGRRTGVTPDLFSIRKCVLASSGGSIMRVTPGGVPFTPEFVRDMLREGCRLSVLKPSEESAHATTPQIEVMFMAHVEIFDEWQKDMGSKRDEIKISLNDLREENDKEPWFLPGKHKQRLTQDGKPKNCWAIALAAFPHAQDFRDALEEPGQ